MCMCRCVFGKKARKQQFERLWIGFTRLASGPELVDEVHSVAAAGLAVGTPVSLAVATTLRSMLYGLSSSDPFTILVAFMGIAIVTLAAAFFPAHRAASIDPMRALRME